MSEFNNSSKKFVIAIEEHNIDKFEKLTSESRSDLVNKTLTLYDVTEDGNYKPKKELKMLKHLVIVVATLLIGFPLLFFAINQSLKFTVENYSQMSNEFENIYGNGNIKQSKFIEPKYK